MQLRVDCAAMDYRRNAIDFFLIMKFQMFEFLQLVVVKVSFVTDSFFWQSGVLNWKVSLLENLTTKTEKRISSWMRCMKTKLQLNRTLKTMTP